MAAREGAPAKPGLPRSWDQLVTDSPREMGVAHRDDNTVGPSHLLHLADRDLRDAITSYVRRHHPWT